MITVFISKYCREFTRLREFFGRYNMDFEVVPLQATDQRLTLPDYKNLVRGLGKSEGVEDFQLLVSQKRRAQLAPKLCKMTPEEQVAFFNENITALRGAITYDSERDMTFLGFDEDELSTLLPRDVKKEMREQVLQHARQLEQGVMV